MLYSLKSKETQKQSCSWVYDFAADAELLSVESPLTKGLMILIRTGKLEVRQKFDYKSADLNYD